MSMIPQAATLSARHLGSADFKARNPNYEELLNISADFESKRAAYDEIGTGVVKILFKFNAVHAIKYQLINSEELMEKLADYQQQHPNTILNLSNYEELIENLISIRIISLFKSDWAKIHESILDQFVLIGNVTANVSAADAISSTSPFTDKGLSLKTETDGYRSIDYVIKTAPSKKEYKVAVQVRSIFEEGWAEIDHLARYKDKMDASILNEFSKTLQNLSNGADEMAEFIHGLQSYLLSRESQLEEQKNLAKEQQDLVKEQELLVKAQENLVQEQQSLIAALKAELAQAQLQQKEKESISSITEKASTKGSEGMLGKDIIEDLAKTAAAIDGGSSTTEVSSFKAEPVKAAKEKTEEKVGEKSEESDKASEEKPKPIKSKAEKTKVSKSKEEKSNEEKPRLEMAPPIVEDLFGQTRIPDAAPLKPSVTNA
ncbi:hypothetical protein [Pedobacter gandavensis]|uniref:hypothetical protein n=1 Tax=Pedobacter gandavensis TaxID=2679963 RepID=UPI00292E43F5|nr:hypothetical protein [Pedobacter gandavensis]